MNSPVKISIVNYYNTTPFVYGIDHSPVKSQMHIELDYPSACAQKLKEGRVDVGIVPVAILPELDHYEIITDYCLGAVGRVDSVKLFASRPLEELTQVMLDYQSKSSVTLIRVLNQFFWKKNIRFVQAAPGYEDSLSGTTGGVIIGDRALVSRNTYEYQYDLAEEWQKYTGLPFVFAAWVSNKKLDDDFISGFNQALGYGVSHIADAVKAHPKEIRGFDAYDYLANKMSYTLDGPKKEALSRFLSYIGKLQ